MNTRAHASLYEHEKTWFFAACACLVAVIGAYMYFLSASVMHVVMRKEVDREYASLASEVSVLEAKYIDVQHKVSEDIATLHGFTKTDTKVFIDRTTQSLSLRTP